MSDSVTYKKITGFHDADAQALFDLLLNIKNDPTKLLTTEQIELISKITNKVDKETGKSLLADIEIERLLTLSNYDDTEIKADIETLQSNVSANATEIAKKADTTYVDSAIAEIQVSGGGITEEQATNLAKVPQIETDVTTLKTDSHTHSNKSVLDSITTDKVAEWDSKSEFSGSYNDLIDKPTIPTVPTKTSDLTNDSSFITSTELDTAISNVNGGTGLTEEQTQDVAKIGEIETNVNALQTTVGDDTSGLVKDVIDLKARDVVSTDGTGFMSNNSSIGNTKYLLNNAIRPLITFTDDDGKAGVYTKLLPIMKEKGVKFALSIINNYLDTTGYLTTAQVKELQDDYGCEIISHGSHTIFTGMTKAQIVKDLKNSKEQLMAKKLKVNGYAFPSGNFYGSDGLDYSYLCADQYDYALITLKATNTYPLSNSMKIDRFAIGCYGLEDDSLTAWKAKVDETIQNNSWLIFMTHVDDTGHTDEDTTNLNLLIDYIKEKNVDIVTVGEGNKIFGNIVEGKNIITNQGEIINEGNNPTSELTPATKDDLGGIIVGDSLSVTSTGVLNVNGDLYYNKSYLDEVIAGLETRIQTLEENSGTEAVSVTGVTLDKETLSIAVGEVYQLNKTVLPTDATVKKVTWESDNTFATVNSNGLVTAVAEGEATITVKTIDGNYTDTCVVTVTPATQVYDLPYYCENNAVEVSDRTYKITDDAKYDNVRLLYDPAIVANGNYNLCYKVIERNITTSDLSVISVWNITHVGNIDVDLATVNIDETIKVPITIYENTATTGNASYLSCVQLGNTNTGDTITVKMWLESV